MRFLTLVKSVTGTYVLFINTAILETVIQTTIEKSCVKRTKKY